MMILYGGHGYVFPSEATACALGVCRAKFLIFSRTMLIPRSSDAFSSRTRFLKLSGLPNNVRGVLGKTLELQHTQRVVVPEPGWSMSSQSLVDRRIACVATAHFCVSYPEE